MGRPVKVSDELFGRLRTKAETEGLSMMDALSRHVAQAEQRIADISSEVDRLEGEVKATQQKAKEAGRESAASQQSAKELQGRIESLNGQVSELRAERERLIDVSEEWSERAEACERELEEVQHQHAGDRKEAEKWITGGWLLAALLAAIALWQAYHRVYDQPSRGQAQDAAIPHRPG